MKPLQSIFFLLMCTVLQIAVSQVTEADQNVGIYGGHEIEIEDAPYMVGIFKNGRLVCGGSIVHERFILTSASCAKKFYPVKRARVGSRRARKGGLFLFINETLCHEEFDRHTFDNNICLLKLPQRLVLEGGRSKIAKVELPEENIKTVAGTMVNVTGWGSIASSGDRTSKFLQQATISVLSDVSCFLFTPNMTPNMLCAGYEGRDACRGDGGGPLTQNNVQLGIVSSGPAECGHQPTVYTKVSKFVTWIRTTIQNNLKSANDF